jgi:threonylcarbamoyladenosine tRNA methylthiotransferase MtaB
MRFYVTYFGCRANQAEIQEWIIELEQMGYQLTRELESADFAILNTCSITAKAEKEVLRHMERMYHRSDIPWVIAGCSVSNLQQEIQNRFPDYIFLDNEQKKDLVALVAERFPAAEENLIYHSAYRSRLFLKIQDGCQFRCAYCIVPLLRGKPHSQLPEDIVKKARRFVALGYKELILTGINLSSYGLDLFPRPTLIDLLTQLQEIRDLQFLRLSSLDPRFLGFDFIRQLSLLEKIAPSFHFSLQSGSDSVLKRMSRSSKARQYHQIMEHFQRYFPTANLGADFITGFPEETEQEFQDTVDFIYKSPLTYLHVFPFSPRPGTRAAEMPPVDPAVIAHRMAVLTQLNHMRKIAYRERFVGQKLSGILTEENVQHATVVTSNYLTVQIPPRIGYKRRKVWVRLERVLNDSLCQGVVCRPDKASADGETDARVVHGETAPTR